MNNRQIGILLGGMCCLLTIGICVQVRTVSSTSSTFGRTQTENELRDSVSRWQEKYKNAYNKLTYHLFCKYFVIFTLLSSWIFFCFLHDYHPFYVTY